MAASTKTAFRLAMLKETARAGAWAAGLGLAVLAVFGPLAHEHFYVAEFRKDVASAVDAAVVDQRRELVRREKFSPATVPVAWRDKRIVLQARVVDEGRLLVRGMTSADAVQSRWLPAMIYERQVDLKGSVSEGKWLAGN